MATKRKAEKGSIIIPFSKEEKGEGRVNTRIAEGDYPAKITAIKPETSQAGNPMIVFTFELTEGKHKGKKYRDRPTLTPKSMWKLRSILEAAGLEVPEGRDIKLSPKKVLGKEVVLSIVDDEYEDKNGKTVRSSSISDYLDRETFDGQQEEEEDEDDEDVDEDEDEDEDDDDEDDDLEDLDEI